MNKIETVILKNLISNEDFCRKVLPFLKPEYFLVGSEKLLAEQISEFITKYNNLPTIEALKINIEKLPLREEDIISVNGILDNINSELSIDSDPKWLLDETEKFCKDKSLHNAILESINIMDTKSKKDTGAIPALLQEALAVSFDTRVGHNYLDDWEERWEYYNRKENKIPFDLETLNEATNGGVMTKTLNVLMGGVHAGKTLSLCHLAAAYLTQGDNVLYVTLEMAEEEIAKRIDANLLNVEMDNVKDLPKDAFGKKITNIKAKTIGKLVVRQYPTASASVLHFNALMNELYLKHNYKPTIVVVDYLNICGSARLKKGVSLYEYVKSVAEELRGFAIEHNVVVWSATQLNRTGFASSDPGMEHSSESFGLPATADLLWILIVSEELKELEQGMFKQEKEVEGFKYYA